MKKIATHLIALAVALPIVGCSNMPHIDNGEKKITANQPTKDSVIKIGNWGRGSTKISQRIKIHPKTSYKQMMDDVDKQASEMSQKMEDNFNAIF